MFCTSVSRLVSHSHKMRRNLFSVLCRHQHEDVGLFEIAGHSPKLKQERSMRQDSSTLNSTRKVYKGHQNRKTVQHQVQPVNIKNIFSDDDTVVLKPETNPEKELEQDVGPRITLNSVPMAAFQSKLAQCDDLFYSHEDWDSLKQDTLAENSELKKTWETLCMQLMFHYGQTKLASSFIDYLNSVTSSPKITTLSLYVALQGRHGTEEKEQIIKETYRDILKISDIFDSITAKYLISGLSQISLWRTAVDILEMAKLTTSPGSSYYSPIITAAIREHDTQLAFMLLDELTMKGFEPQDIVLQEILRVCKNTGSHDFLERYFSYAWKYSWMFSPSMAKEVEQYFTGSEKEKWTCKWTSVNTVRGICHQCKHGLDRIELSTTDFEALQREFLERALVGGNVYLQSNPEEVEEFKDFVMENAPFHVVLDALNIAFKGQGRNDIRKSKQLRDVVHYFARERHLKVLVIGRAHMKKWPASDMKYISRHAKTFFTDDISSDDPFCLYATLYSGRDCLFVSGDFMRNHKYNLGPAFKEVFERWQKSRQIVNFVAQPEGVSVIMPSQYDCGPVRDDKGWHIPYNDGTVDLRSGSQTVLCLRYRGERKTPRRLKKETASD